MSPQHFLPDHKAALDGILLGVPGVTTRLSFGQPSYCVRGKMFACLMLDGVAIKVPDEIEAELMARDNVIPFAPGGGGSMRHWVQINVSDPAEYDHYTPYLEHAFQYVLDLASVPKKG